MRVIFLLSGHTNSYDTPKLWALGAGMISAQTPPVGLLRSLVDIFINLGFPVPMAWSLSLIIIFGFVGGVLTALQ